MTVPATDVRPDDARQALPPGAGVRALRRRHQRQVRRQRLMFLLAGLVALAAVFYGISLLPDDGDAPPTPDEAAAVAEPTHLPRVLLAHRPGPDGGAKSLAVFAPEAKGGSVVLIPTGTMAEVPSLGLEAVGKALELGGPSRLLGTVENLLGVEIEDVVLVDDAGLSDIVAPLGSLVVDVPSRVERVDEAGTVEVLYEPGRVDVRPGEVPALLSVRGRADEINLVARQQAFWQALLTRLRENPDHRIGGPASFRRAMKRLTAAESEVRTVPVQSLGRGETEADELYQVREADLARVVKLSFPGDSAALGRPRVQILNGTGELELAPKVVDKLRAARVRVTLTGNANSFDHDTTEIVFYDRRKQAVAERVRKALGTGRLVFSRRPLDVVDVTVIVGKDFAAK
ncbi:MAG TPA: LCP family protein [Acidimicrobiales bacterium]|nr:LCP family protein [Acidimicrobiales bacterium]